MIGRLERTVIDCPDPRALAEFYCQVLGMSINQDIGGWVVIGSRPGLRELAFQRAAFCRLTQALGSAVTAEAYLVRSRS